MSEIAVAPQPSTPAHGTPGSAGTTGAVNYLHASTESSLYRNGRVLTRRDADGSDTGWVGYVRNKLALGIHDARAVPPQAGKTLEHNGFELLHRPGDIDGIDFLDHAAVVRHHYPRCAEIVREHTGARVFAFDHNVRSASGKRGGQRISGGQQVQGPALMAHGDYTLTSAPRRVRDLALAPKLNDTLRGVLLDEGQSLISPDDAARVLAPGGRFAIINVWRSIALEPVQALPLALCDAQTVLAEDLVVFEIHYQDRIGENYFAKHSPRHQWFYYPQMTRDEALLIKQWDSAGPLARSAGAKSDASEAHAPCTFSFHTAFVDAATPADAPDRWSIETRCLVLYD
ncbi:MAG: hypothetical protein JNM79_13865 [Burkholderiales bacterium]|nr:hypothetical protein [Burkholderiales bacterium]